MTPAHRCFAFVLLAAVSQSSLARAAPKPRDIKVCVRIEEKSWARDGSMPEPSTPKPATPERNATPAAAQIPSQKPEDTRTQVPSEPPAGATLPPEPAPFAIHSSAPNPTRAAAPSAADSSAIDPILYLKRLMEYHVTHEPGFE
jgi:hypothetical protein